MANKLLLCVASTPSIEDSITGYMNEYQDVEIFEETPADVGEEYMIDLDNMERAE